MLYSGIYSVYTLLYLFDKIRVTLHNGDCIRDKVVNFFLYQCVKKTHYNWENVEYV